MNNFLVGFLLCLAVLSFFWAIVLMILMIFTNHPDLDYKRINSSTPLWLLAGCALLATANMVLP